MPPNFPEFAERMEASLSEVSEAGASNPSLQEKKELSSPLTESSGHLNHRELQSESVSLEHVSKSIGILEVQDVKILSGDCQDFRFQQHSESSPHEFQPLESEAAAASGNTDVMQEHRFSSATWPRAMKSSAKGGFSEKQHPLGDAACTVEMPPLSPCLSEELLDPELHSLITPSLREKTESELKFEEDERWIMMEAEEWEEEKLSEKEKTFVMTDENNLADSFEEREQMHTVAEVEVGANCLAAVVGTFDDLALGQICCTNDPQPGRDHLSSVPKDALSLDYSCITVGEDATGEMKKTAQGLESLASELEFNISPVETEQLSDTDSVQMFLELEKECLCEEGVTAPVELQNQASSEGLASAQDAEHSVTIRAALEKEQHGGLPNVKDHDTLLNNEYFNAMDSSQVPDAVESIVHPNSIRDTSMVSKEYEKVPFSPETTGEFKSPTDLDSLGELDPGDLLNSDHRDFCKEKLSGFIASELAKENGNLTQADYSQAENVEYIEVVPLSFACSYQLTETTSGPGGEALLCNLSLLTDKHLQNEKEVINQKSNNLTSLANVDSSELSVRKVCGEDDEGKELDHQARLLGDRAPAYCHSNFPEQVFQDLQRKLLESETLSPHLLAGELRHGDGVETLNDTKPEPNVASSQGEEIKMGDLDSFLSIFPEEQVTKASSVEPVLEEWIPSLQGPVQAAIVLSEEEGALDATLPTLEEDITVAAVPAPEETAEVASEVPFPEEDIPFASLPTAEIHVPAASGVILKEDITTAVLAAPVEAAAPALGVFAPKGSVPVAAMSSPEGTDPAAAATITEEAVPAVKGSSTEVTAAASAVPITEEDDTLEGLVTPATAGQPPEELAPPAAAVSILEEPDSPTVRVSTPEELDTPAVTDSTPKEPPTPTAAVPAPERPATLATAVPAMEDISLPGRPFLRVSAHTDSVPVSEEGTLVLDDVSPTRMWFREDLDSSAFGMKEVPGIVLHGKVSLATTDGLNSNEMFQKEQVDPLQMKLQQVNGLGQGLIQSAGKNCDVQGLEHDMEEINARWNTLNKKVAQRIAQLQEALLHCGKFQDALEPLLSWLTDTEELIANQKPPSAEYKVVKAQIQEQKLLQRLLDDRKATVDMLQAEGDRIAQSAELADREKITGQLASLESRWTELLSKAAARQKQLEDILVLAKQFHETAEPISDFLSVTEKKLANSEPVGTQTAKIQQQIVRHKALEEEIENHAADVHQAVNIGRSLSSLTCPAEQGMLSEKLDLLQAQYSEIQDRCCRKAALLEQALCNARLFGEDEVEVLNWLAEVEDKLSSVFVKDYRQDVLQKQHADHLALNEEIVNRKKNVDQAIKNGQALLKQTTGEEVLLIQEKLDGIKTRYVDITVTSSKALRTLEQARQLATKFQSTYEELTGWLREVEQELAASGGQSPTGEQIPQFQQRQKELKKEVMEHRLVLDTVNEVSRALLELVPWRAREGLDKLVSDANEQYKLISDTVGQRVDEIDAAIQRSQQYEQAADAELAWVAETKRKLMALGPIRLEQDQTTAQLQVQKAFSIDIIRHKDSMDELFSHRGEIFATCGEEQKAVLQEKQNL